MFSLQRLMGEALLPDGATYTFWGKGLSQGHSDAIRRIPGVAGGVQYTIPVDEAVQRVRSGVRPELSARERHRRECFVVLEQGANADGDRKSTRLNSSHLVISYAVFCLKKKKTNKFTHPLQSSDRRRR